MPLLDVIREHPRGLLVAMGSRIGTNVAFYTFTLYILTFVTTNLGLSRTVGLTTVLIVVATVVALATHAAMYGPQAAFVAEMFSTRLRYSGASMGYQIAGVLGGAVAPLVSIALAEAYGTPFAVSCYVLAMLVLTLVALWFAPETARIDLHEAHPDTARTRA